MVEYSGVEIPDELLQAAVDYLRAEEKLTEARRAKSRALQGDMHYWGKWAQIESDHQDASMKHRLADLKFHRLLHQADLPRYLVLSAAHKRIHYGV